MTGGSSQGCEVYLDDGTVRARHRASGREVLATADASEAIQAAVDRLPETGGSVLLHEGRYVLRKELHLADNVWLRGSGRATELVLAREHDTGVGILCRGLGGALVSDLALKAGENADAEAGVVLDDCGDCQVRDLFCVGFAGYGVWMRNNSFLCEVRGCRLAENGKAGVFADHLADGGRIGNYVPNLVSGCVVYAGGAGIECRRAIVLNILGCAVYQSAGPAYHIHTTSNSVLVSGCRSFQVSDAAVVVDTAHEINISSNIFCWHLGHGIVVRDVKWGSINANNVIDSGSGRRDARLIGILLEGETAGVQVVGNSVFNWGGQLWMEYGIREHASCRNNVILGNNVNFFTEGDVLAEGEGTTCANNVSQKEPSYLGAPRHPDPFFDRGRTIGFVDRYR